MKNKFAAIVIAIAMAFSFVACSNDDGDSKSEPETVTVTETATAEPETEEPYTPSTPDTPVEPPANDLDALFLQVLREGTNAWDNVPDGEIISLAQEMCGAWGRGASFEEVAQVFIDSGFGPEESGYFIGAGTEAYCPEYSDKFN